MLLLCVCKYIFSFELHWQFLSKIYWRLLTDEEILGVLQDLQGDDSEENETKSDIENYESCVSLRRQERSIWTVWSFCQSYSSTGGQWQQQSSWNISQDRFSC